MKNFEVGDIVARRKDGRTFTLDDVNPNPNWKEDDEYYASGWSDYGTEDVLDPKDIKLVMKAVDASKRTLPSVDEIAQGLDLMGGWDGPVDVDETDFEGSGQVACFGKTQDGLRVSFIVTVSSVMENDL